MSVKLHGNSWYDLGYAPLLMPFGRSAFLERSEGLSGARDFKLTLEFAVQGLGDAKQAAKRVDQKILSLLDLDILTYML